MKIHSLVSDECPYAWYAEPQMPQATEELGRQATSEQDHRTDHHVDCRYSGLHGAVRPQPCMSASLTVYAETHVCAFPSDQSDIAGVV